MLRSVAIGLLFALANIASAQSDSSAAPSSRVACWRGKPEPQCHTFWITEVSGEYSYASTQTHYRFVYSNYVNAYDRTDVTSQVLWTVGPMFNTSPTRALGATVSWGYLLDGSRIALEGRRRYWTAPEGGFDISAGLLRANVPPRPNEFATHGYGATAGVSVVGKDLIHINAHTDLILTGGRVRAGGTVGGGVGSYPAAVLTVLTAAYVAVAVFAIARVGDF